LTEREEAAHREAANAAVAKDRAAEVEREPRDRGKQGTDRVCHNF